jgi:glycopeptide antibiotics resistance protein
MTTLSGVLPFLVYAALVPGILWRARRHGLPTGTLTAQLLLGAWVAALVALTLFPLPWRTDEARPTVVSDPREWPLPWASIAPFATIRASLHAGFGSAMGRVLIGNVLAFVPLGFLAPMADRRWASLVRILALGLVVSTAVELAQLGWDLVVGLPWRSADVDDVTVNTLGALVGYGLWRAATAVRTRRRAVSPA